MEPDAGETKNAYERVAELPPAMAERARGHITAALDVVRQLDPIGVGTRDLRECLLVQVEAQRKEFELIFVRTARAERASARAASHAGGASSPKPAVAEVHAVEASHATGHEVDDHRAADASNGNGTLHTSLSGTFNGNGAGYPTHFAPPVATSGNGTKPETVHPEESSRLLIFELARQIIDTHMLLLQKRDPRELSKVVGKSVEETQRAIDFIRTLEPRPGQRYNRSEARLIEPDVAFVKRGDEWVVGMNEEDLPTLRLNQGYRRLLSKDGTEKDVKDYVKERYRSALQLMRNIEQRKNTILRTCEAIVRRQGDFLEKGVEALKPMMIKEVAEEIGVHPSTVSRAVSSKYVHTPQGVFELRFFFSEGVNGPEGAGTPLMLLKRKVKKLIEDEDPRKPLTDDQIAIMLQGQGIDVTRRTVAKYREDLRIPSTHQRRVRG
jgi:RNA polymerase sigma-54 factor